MMDDQQPAIDTPAEASAPPVAPPTPALGLQGRRRDVKTAGVPGTDGPNDFAFIPEKNRILKEDGTIDLVATLRRTDEHRTALESRMGKMDIRPLAADGYTFEATPELAPMVATFPDEAVKAFKAEAHEAGLTQSQYEFVMNKYLQVAPVLAKGGRTYDANSAIETLQQEWQTPREYLQNVERANAAIRGYGGDDAEGIFRDYGNDPRIAKMMARIGAEIGEDTAPQGASAPRVGSAQELLRHPAYSDPKHPEHARVSAAVRHIFESTHGGSR